MGFIEIALIVLAAVALLFTVTVIYGALRLYFFAIRRHKAPPRALGELPLERMLRKNKKESYDRAVNEGVAYMKKRRGEAEEVFITSFDGLRLHGALYTGPRNRGVIVECHGFHSLAEADFAPSMSFFEDEGFALLQIDQRAHGHSEGKHVCFGVKERYDVRAWLNYAAERFPGLPLFLFGISMGCASALMGSELPELPRSFRGVIADCGYDSPYEEVRWFVRHFFKMRFPDIFLVPANLICRAFAGFSMHDCSVMEHIDSISVPVLYIHGTDDDVVPPVNAERICAALGDKARLVMVNGALHGTAFLEDPERIKTEIRGFLDKCI